MAARRVEPIVLLASVFGLLVVASAGATRPLAAEQRTTPTVSAAGIRAHLVAFQRIAERNGGNRAAGTKGYDESARYVAARMRAAGYRVRMQEFSFPFVADRTPPTLRALGAGEWTYRVGRDYATLAYSGSGRVEASVIAVDLLVPSPNENSSTSGCEAADYSSFSPGAVALVQRGTCTFRRKVANAIAAGASAVVVFNEGNEGRRDLFAGTLGPPQVRVPVLAASSAVGDALRGGKRNGATGIVVRLETDVVVEQRRTRNVLAESRAGDPANVVLVGAHLDSVERGPGINDNGSGSAAILEVAEELAKMRPRNRLRFAWWAAEEVGLVGSRYHVGRLSAVARRRIALYLNFDMVGSPNYVRFVYDGDASARPAGSAGIERVFSRYFEARGLALREVGMGGSSDHVSFARAGIPIGGLFTGADGGKSDAQAAAFGGRAGEPFDPCYHRPCDTLENVSNAALVQMGRAAAYGIAFFARDTSSVRRAR